MMMIIIIIIIIIMKLNDNDTAILVVTINSVLNKNSVVTDALTWFVRKARQF